MTEAHLPDQEPEVVPADDELAARQRTRLAASRIQDQLRAVAPLDAALEAQPDPDPHAEHWRILPRRPKRRRIERALPNPKYL